jgi:hypothetical protein
MTLRRKSRMKEQREERANLSFDSFDEEVSEEICSEVRWVPVAMKLALAASEREIGTC